MSIRNGAVVLLVSALLALTGRAAEPAKAPLRKNAHALLIGVTFYENLAKSKHLEGPANDIELMYRVLIERFHFDPTHIRKLSENDGKASKDYLPTRANIQREFERLAKEVQEGDEVLIHLGGLGSRQPERPAAPDPEPDGLDKIFLPRDTGKWDAAKGTVTNAILDDDIADWVKAIRNRKASVCIVFDVCHSGTVSRGAGNERTRDADPLSDLGIPQAALAAAIGAARAAGPPKAPFKFGNKGGIGAVCAAQADELTVERTLPPRSAHGQVHGLLSYTAAAVLMQAADESTQPIAYSELARRVQARYIGWGRSFPTVQVEGGDCERALFGDKVWPGRSSILLGGKAGALTINAGALHGLTPDSILSVAPPPGKGNDRLGYVFVKNVRPFEADVVPCEADGKPAATVFPEAALCEKHLLAAEDSRLRVAIDPIDGKGRRMAAEFEKKLREQLKTAVKESAVLQMVEKPEQADWLVRQSSQTDDRIILVPVTGWSGGRDSTDIAGLGPMKVDNWTSDFLVRTLEALNRAACLKRLPVDIGNRGSVRVTAELVRYASRRADDIKKPLPVAWAGAAVPLYDRELVALRISNPTKKPIDVAVLFVSSKYGIESLYPRKGETNRIEPNDSLIVPAPSDRPSFFTVNTRTVGMEYLLIVASKPLPRPDDFAVLQQQDLEGTVERGLPRPIPRNALLSPLGQLLRRGVEGQGTIRGLTPGEIDDHAVMMIPLLTRVGKRP